MWSLELNWVRWLVSNVLEYKSQRLIQIEFIAANSMLEASQDLGLRGEKGSHVDFSPSVASMMSPARLD